MSQYVIIDFEMCNVDSKETDLYQEIIQIGAVLLDNSYKIIDQFKTYVSPQYGKIDRYIEELTGIHPTDVKEAPIFKDALNQFIKWLPEDAVLVS